MLMKTATTSSSRITMNHSKKMLYPNPRFFRTIFGRFAPLSRMDIMPAAMSCTAPMRTHPSGMMTSAMMPNLMPRITPITGPMPAMFSSWISMFFQRGRTT